jgi:hypothetical protein
MVAAWLERDISNCSLCRAAGGSERVYFGMRTAGALVPAAAYHFPVANDYATHPGIGTGTVQALLSKLQSLGHIGMISRRKRGERLAHCKYSPENKAFSGTPSIAC